MDQDFTVELNDTICSLCYCEDKKFLHHVWKESKARKICTSCVLFEHSKFFCQTCFDMVDLRNSQDLVICVTCGSGTHLRCCSGNREIQKFVCLTCKYPDRLIFDLNKTMDTRTAQLLLTAAKVVERMVSEAHKESEYSAKIQAIETVSAKKKATDAVNLFMKSAEHDSGPSLLDSSPETSWETAS